LRGRSTLRGVVVIVDVRRGLETEELELLAFLAEHGRPAALVATKLDRLGRGAATAAMRRLEGTAGGAVPGIAFSAQAGEGRDRFWKVVGAWLKDAGA